MIDYYETKSQPITRLMVWRAYQRVRSKGRGSGVDGMTWDYMEKHKSQELYKLWNRLSSGSYYPEAVRQVQIPKSDGGLRTLGIPTLLDRIAQEVVRSYLEPRVEPIFHEHSYGYRKGRNAHQAVKGSLNHCFNHDFVIDMDIKGYFDNIDHGLLIRAVQHYCGDKWVLMYIKRWIESGILTKTGEMIWSSSGTP